MISESEHLGIRMAVKNWNDGKCDIGHYLYERCCAYAGGGHSKYCATLLNIACMEVRAAEFANPALKQPPQSLPCSRCGVPVYPVPIYCHECARIIKQD